MELIHTCHRVCDPERSIAFYEALGFEKRRELPIRDEAVNYFLGVPGGNGPELELIYNFGVDSYDVGTGYGHIAVTVDDIELTLARLAEKGDRAREGPLPRPGGRLPDSVRPRPGWLVEEVEVGPRSRSWRRHRIRRAGSLRLCPSSQATLGAELATADTTAARRDTASYSQG
jgi:lactoylglutathione lyase